MRITLFTALLTLLIIQESLAQASQAIAIDVMLSNVDDSLLKSTQVGVRVRFRENAINGTIAYEETFTSNTDDLGQLRIAAGQGTAILGSFNGLSWNNITYFLELSVDPNGGTDYELNQTVPLNTIPQSEISLQAGTIAQIDYSSIINNPQVITALQRDKIDNITVTGVTNLDQLSQNVMSNNNLDSFPGFGTSPGTVYQRVWTLSNDNLFFNTGSVNLTGVNNIASDGLKLSGNLNLVRRGFGTEPGTLFYDNTGTSSLLYINENAETVSIAAQQFVTGAANPFTDSYTTGDLVIGRGFEQFTSASLDNQVVICDPEPDIFFDDTSSSAAFPKNDWSISVDNLDEASFDILDQTAGGVKAFSITPASLNDALVIDQNGAVKILGATSMNKLSINGALEGNFSGNATGITGITAIPTASISNTGSTTIAADNDDNDSGSILFNIANQEKLRVSENGMVTNRSTLPEASLDIQGTIKTTTASFGLLKLNGAKIRKIETVSTLPANYTDSDVILYNGGDTNLFQPFLEAGKEVTIINVGTDTITFSSLFTPIKPPGVGGNIALENLDSITLIGTANGTAVKEIVR